MSKQAILHKMSEENIEVDARLRSVVGEMSEAAMLCESKDNNPNYFSITHANKEFYKIFGVSDFNLIGKSYDFLFSDFELNYSSEDQIEYVRLIKDVKYFRHCSIIIKVSDHRPEPTSVKLKVTFIPQEGTNNSSHRYAIFTFEKLDIEMDDSKKNENSSKLSSNLLRNLERMLRNEKLLRQVGNLIIDDSPIYEIAKNIAKILCEYLKVDRCLIHDYKESATSFVAEHCSYHSKPMFKGVQDKEVLKKLTRYINFQNYFYENFGDKNKRSSLSIVEDISSDQNFSKISDICKEFSIISQVAVTTTFNGKVNGGIYIHQPEKRVWLEDEIELIETISDQFSIALDRSNSIDRVMIANHALMERTSQLKKALQQEKEMRKIQNEFVALVSHEFKTPLQIIDSTRELLMRKIKKYNITDDGTIKSFKRIKDSIQRMNGLIHSTLNLAKMESGKNKISVENVVFNFKEFIEEIIEKSTNLAINRNISFLTKVDELPEEFKADPKLLDHSFTNIISNAVKYSKDNSVVKIIARANNKRVVLRVTDQGIGIPKSDLENVGKKFFRAKNTLSVAGTGIGLYLTKYFIELHGGSVLIESKINVGTSVTVTLPRI